MCTPMCTMVKSVMPRRCHKLLACRHINDLEPSLHVSIYNEIAPFHTDADTVARFASYVLRGPDPKVLARFLKELKILGSDADGFGDFRARARDLVRAYADRSAPDFAAFTFSSPSSQF